MNVFLLKNIVGVGLKNEIVKVSSGYARNFLFPQKAALEVNKKNSGEFAKSEKKIAHRKDVIESKTSMLAGSIQTTKLTIKCKTHDNGKLYASVTPQKIVAGLSKQGISIAKNQVIFNKSIKAVGEFDVTIKLSSKLLPTIKLKVISEDA